MRTFCMQNELLASKTWFSQEIKKNTHHVVRWERIFWINPLRNTYMYIERHEQAENVYHNHYNHHIWLLHIIYNSVYTITLCPCVSSTGWSKNKMITSQLIFTSSIPRNLYLKNISWMRKRAFGITCILFTSWSPKLYKYLNKHIWMSLYFRTTC